MNSGRARVSSERSPPSLPPVTSWDYAKLPRGLDGPRFLLLREVREEGCQGAGNWRARDRQAGITGHFTAEGRQRKAGTSLNHHAKPESLWTHSCVLPAGTAQAGWVRSPLPRCPAWQGHSPTCSTLGVT